MPMRKRKSLNNNKIRKIYSNMILFQSHNLLKKRIPQIAKRKWWKIIIMKFYQTKA